MAHRILFVFLWLLSICGLASSSHWIKLDHTSVRMITEYEKINGSEPFWLVVEFQIQPHWHTYWRNPGDSGMAPRFRFNLPEGFQASDIHWLPPQRIPAGSFVNYGYEERAYHLVKITPSKTLSASIIPIELEANWLVCEEECIPEKASLSLHLSQADKNIASPFYDIINGLVAKSKLPSIEARAFSSGGHLQLQLPEKLSGELYFYPIQKGIIEPGKNQRNSIEAGKSNLNIVCGGLSPEYPIKGILEINTNGQKQYFRLSATFAPPEEASFLPLLLLFAVLGGLILNLMPCVFPVLSLKVLALKSSSNKKLQGLFYTLGVVTTFCAIAGIMLVLQSFGKNIGWGFQLQSPLFNIGLIYLFTFIALNLFGFFEVPFSVSTNMGWQNSHKYLYAYFTGVLACVVATPCSAPFMATAVGVALSKDIAVAMLIFAFLGLGLALPYLLICFIPMLANLLPKPGAWMETVKQFLAFPMLLSVLWLLWVLGQQVAFDVIMLIIASLVFLLFTFWLKGRMKRGVKRMLSMIIAVGLVVYPLYSIHEKNMLRHRQSMRTQVFSQERLQSLVNDQQKVFVYATAAWCITCKVNERLALDTAAVKSFFKKEKIHALKADWTNQDATILKYLQSFGRAGVPLYVYYSPGEPPKILPQLLTPSIIIESIKGENP